MIMQWIMSFFSWLGSIGTAKVTSPAKEKFTVKAIPGFGDRSPDVGVFQRALTAAGFFIDDDEWFYTATKTVCAKFQRSKGLEGTGIPGPETMRLLGIEVTGAASVKVPAPPNPVTPQPAGSDISTLRDTEWMPEAMKYKGKSEHDSKFGAFLGAFWTPVTKLTGMGLSLLQSWRAWCALFFGFVAMQSGYDFYKSGLAAEMGGKTGKTIEHKLKGAPRGAGVWKQTNGQNHICFLNGNCTAEALTCKDCTFDCYGGNQSDAVGIATYKVSDIKRIFWLEKKDGTGEPFPGRVVKNINCTSGKSTGGSTR